MLGVQQPLNRFVERDAGGDEDGCNDGEPCQLLSSEATDQECDAQREGGERIAGVVDRDRQGARPTPM